MAETKARCCFLLNEQVVVEVLAAVLATWLAVVHMMGAVLHLNAVGYSIVFVDILSRQHATLHRLVFVQVVVVGYEILLVLCAEPLPSF
jgi:hypothetical protein